jgi:signal transduction histidine kinase
MKYLEYISDATRRAGDLTQQLLAFARRKETPGGQIDVHTVTSTFLPLVEKVQGFARLNYLPPPEPLSILLDPTQLEQIILNLVVNARDAMPRGGVITLSWERITRDGQDEACLKVADTGIGIPPEVMSKIFEPFFTTKDPGKGTGLGLAVVKEIVTEARGRLEVFSTPGVGTRLELSFPINTPA